MEVLELDDDLWEVLRHLLHEYSNVGLKIHVRRLDQIGESFVPQHQYRSFVVLEVQRRVDQRVASHYQFLDPIRSVKSKVSSVFCDHSSISPLTAFGLIPPAAT